MKCKCEMFLFSRDNGIHHIDTKYDIVLQLSEPKFTTSNRCTLTISNMAITIHPSMLRSTADNTIVLMHTCTMAYPTAKRITEDMLRSSISIFDLYLYPGLLVASNLSRFPARPYLQTHSRIRSANLYATILSHVFLLRRMPK